MEVEVGVDTLLSKASLNMLLNLYSSERETHFFAVAPGLVKTPMLESIFHNFDTPDFPSVKRLKESSKFTSSESAKILMKFFPKLLETESGRYVDIRNS